ncbi:MAG: hypothetical protein GC145_17945 [Caulobacter sp.]|nr:hypothetical protein [Caulobacter sp.]
MLLDALKAESFRLRCDRGAVFWGFIFPGLFIFALAMLITVVGMMFKDPSPPKPMSIALEATQGLYWANAFLIQLFVLIGVSAMFAADYRWETWRLQTPRNSRANLILAKLIVYGVAAGFVLLMLLAASVLGALVRGLLIHQSHAPFGEGVVGLQFLRAVAAGWLELMVVGAASALIAVLTRSNMAAILIPVLATGAQAFGLGVAQIHPGIADPEVIFLAPNLAAQVLRGDGEAMGGGAANAWWALAGLLTWVTALSAATIVLFSRQELSRE